MVIVLSFWPRKKNLEQLLACSVAIIVGMQFWFPYAGGGSVLWYLPLLLLVVFRPKLNQSYRLQQKEARSLVASIDFQKQQKQELVTAGSSHQSLFR